eukprot:2997518-Prymnesium_polylepis.1
MRVIPSDQMSVDAPYAPLPRGGAHACGHMAHARRTVGGGGSMNDTHDATGRCAGRAAAAGCAVERRFWQWRRRCGWCGRRE